MAADPCDRVDAASSITNPELSSDATTCIILFLPAVLLLLLPDDFEFTTGDVGGLRISAGSKKEYTFDLLDALLYCDSVMEISSTSDGGTSLLSVLASLICSEPPFWDEERDGVLLLVLELEERRSRREFAAFAPNFVGVGIIFYFGSDVWWKHSSMKSVLIYHLIV